MAIKLDLQKAYDRVNWRFLKAILLHLGFNEIFIGWIITCVSSVSFESSKYKIEMNKKKNSGFHRFYGYFLNNEIAWVKIWLSS